MVTVASGPKALRLYFHTFHQLTIFLLLSQTSSHGSGLAFRLVHCSLRDANPWSDVMTNGSVKHGETLRLQFHL